MDDAAQFHLQSVVFTYGLENDCFPCLYECIVVDFLVGLLNVLVLVSIEAVNGKPVLEGRK